MIAADLRALVGTPYRLRGRSRAGADCWGLVLLAYRAAGIELPAYNEQAPDERPPGGYVAGWVEVERARAWREAPAAQAEPGDVVLLRIRQAEDHCALIVEPRRWLLTTSALAGAHLSRWAGWAERICGVYRYRAAAWDAAESRTTSAVTR